MHAITMYGLTHGFHNLLNGIKERETYTFIFYAFSMPFSVTNSVLTSLSP